MEQRMDHLVCYPYTFNHFLFFLITIIYEHE